MKSNHDSQFAPGTINRRQWLKSCAVLGGAAVLSPSDMFARSGSRGRDFHLCLNPKIVLADPGWLSEVRQAGISTVWLAGYFYGHWPYSLESMRSAAERVTRAGMEVGVVNIPLGHPGDSLGSSDGGFPLTPPTHWKVACEPGGKTYAGTSLHDPATAENVAALREQRKTRFDRFFVDDDFRLARGPGVIGGCFCAKHRDDFLQRFGYPRARWDELLDDQGQRRLTAILKQWVDFTCDQLGTCFRAMNQAADGRLGIMVMYLGSEKAGIRLPDYRGVPFRVGELMFDDRSFGRIKGKTDELFSALLHRRFAAPELAYSETTAYPAEGLSARNMAAKLTISTIADVRHTMFMSGLTPFPRSHWATLAPAMRRQREIHSMVANHRPRGPFKHFWGEPSRYVGDDRPYSLFLAMGIPFEATDHLATDGWTFLSDADAAALTPKQIRSSNTHLVARPGVGSTAGNLEQHEETLEALLELKQRILPQLGATPCVENRDPAVLAWYPTARAALLWNLSDETKSFSVRSGNETRNVLADPLGLVLLTDLKT
jgi:hypothetical protein